MHFDGRQSDRHDGIAQDDTGVRVAGGVEDDGVRPVVAGLNRLHQLALVVRLGEPKLHLEPIGFLGQQPLDVAQGVTAVDVRLADAQQVEIGPVYDGDLRHCLSLPCAAQNSCGGNSACLRSES